jgi:hypothetical protein
MMKFFGRILGYLFADPGTHTPAGILGPGHLFLAACTIFGIYEALTRTLTLTRDELILIIQKVTLLLWILEVVKIAFRIRTGSEADYDTWIPLYYCSITLYAGIAAGWGHGWLRHIGLVYIATGGLIGGICFMLYPSSSLLIYPTFHFLSLHSFLYHGTMVYLGILANRSGLIDLQMKDIWWYMLYFLFFCSLALIINAKTGSNLMFISKTFPGTFLDVAWKVLGKFYTPVLILVQMTAPFLVIMAFKYHTALLTRPDWYPPIETVMMVLQ